MVLSDEHRLHQVLASLLSKAAKAHSSGHNRHRRPGSRAGKSWPGKGWHSTAERGRRWPGIPSDLQSTLFERFVRAARSRSRAAGSTGLGPAIGDAVTAGHGGSVDLTSGPGGLVLSSRSPA
ncbi:MAG TPA: ATP-binding protein [Streptosporangiaceae bacterium]|jgi:two-component system OmpR family sensor kinase